MTPDKSDGLVIWAVRSVGLGGEGEIACPILRAQAKWLGPCRKGGKIREKMREERGILSRHESVRDFVFLEQSRTEDVISFRTYRPEVMSFGSSAGK